MDDFNEEVRHLAAFALGMLTHKDASSTEAAVRSVLRIASLRNHHHWRIWAELQLTELVDEDAARESIQHLLDDAFPDEHRRAPALDAALADYLATRDTSLTGDGQLYLSDIGDVERDIAMYDASLSRRIDVEVLRQRDLRHRVLNRVKNKAQQYLMERERREGQTDAS